VLRRRRRTHTPGWLRAAAEASFEGLDGHALTTPFAGCYVPLKHYRVDPRVTAIMVELRRDTYMVEPGGQPTDGIAQAIAGLTTLIDVVSTRT
jgi:N-formylglutamate amidohydrolase